MTGVAALYAAIAAGAGDGVKAAGVRSGGSGGVTIDGVKPLHASLHQLPRGGRQRPASAGATIGRRSGDDPTGIRSLEGRRSNRPRSASSSSSGRHRRSSQAPHRARPQSAPAARTSQDDFPGENYIAAPHVPGYMGHVPGVAAKSVFGVGSSAAHLMGQSLREFDPSITSDGWLRRGEWPADRMATYKFSGLKALQSGQDIFSKAQLHEAHDSNTRLGHAFGLSVKEPANQWTAGDRYLHGAPRLCGGIQRGCSVAAMNPAGACSYTRSFTDSRWKNHNMFTTGISGNPKVAY